MEGYLIIFIVLVGLFLLGSIKQINEYERGLLFSFGKFSKILNPEAVTFEIVKLKNEVGR